MHPCSVKPTPNGPPDTDCYNVLAQYTSATLIGTGMDGITLHVAKRDNLTIPLLIKVMPRNEKNALEIRRACVVDELMKRLPELSSFLSRPYGWIACGPPPQSWFDAIYHYYHKTTAGKRLLGVDVTRHYDVTRDPTLYMVSEYGNGPNVRQYRFASMEECREFVFELAYALSRFQRSPNFFQHNDLHIGNVLAVVDAPVPRSYTIARGAVVEIRNAVRPMMIDYGNVTVHMDVLEPFKDMRQFLSTLIDYANPIPEVDDFAHDVLIAMDDDADLMTLDDLVAWLARPLQGPKGLLWGESATKRAKTQDVECFICSDVASRALRGREELVFCGRDACVRKLGSLADLLPSPPREAS
jgi:hypothetical protein